MSSTENVTETLRIAAPSALTERLEFSLERLAQSSSCWQPVDSDQVIIEAYFETAEDAARASNALTMQLMDWTGGTTGWSITQTALPEKDWSQAWKAFFHVDRVSERIVIRPSWEPYTPTPGDCVIQIDPGMSFGTGQHETTRGCLRFLDTLLSGGLPVPPPGFLDLGCGSGILAMAAAKLGCQPVLALDIDEEAVAIAAENIAINGCQDRIRVTTGDVACLALEHPFEIVAANILAPVLIEHAASIAAAVAQGGTLLLAGILSTQYEAVRAAYLPLGFEECQSVPDGEWTSGQLRKR